MTARPPEPILHVDLDAFYASVEVLKDPSLRGKPVVVGGAGPRGVVASASYEARRYGDPLCDAGRAREAPLPRRGLPARRLRRLPGALEPVPRDPARPSRRSWSRSRSTRPSWTSAGQPAVRAAVGDRGEDPGRRRARGRRDVLGGRGVDEVRGQARLRRMQARRPAGRAGRRGDGLPRTAAGGAPVGGGGEDRPRCSGASRSARSATWAARPSRSSTRLLGEQQRPPPGPSSPTGSTTATSFPTRRPKSIGHEETFERDLDDEETILRELLALSGRVASRLRADGYRARTVTLKVRLANFTTLTRARTLPDATDVGADLYRVVAELYRALPGATPAGPAARRAGLGTRPGGRGAARAAPGRALGRRRARGGPDRARASDAARPDRPPSWTATGADERRAGNLGSVGSERTATVPIIV